MTIRGHIEQEAKESFASPDQRFGMKTEVYFVSLRQ